MSQKNGKIVNCYTCGKELYRPLWRIKKSEVFFCCLQHGKHTPKSKNTISEVMKGHIAWNKGLTKETDMRIARQSNITKGRKNTWQADEKHHKWKGDNVGYSALHDWIQNKLGTPSKCSNCGDIDSQYYEWANISHTYKRDLTDWIRLCVLCHRRYDNGLIKLPVVI